MIRVAVGVVINAENQVLIARRGAHQHQGNLWEFPGGKIEPHETLAQALQREFTEELGVSILTSESLEPWLSIDHDYGDRLVRLEVAQINIVGTPFGQEGQAISWRSVNRLEADDFPAANAHIIIALQNGLFIRHPVRWNDAP